jgi:dUTPase
MIDHDPTEILLPGTAEMCNFNPRAFKMKHRFGLVTGRIEKATRHSAAFDVFYAGTEPLLIGDKPIIIPTGVRTEFSHDLVAVIKEKSGLAVKGVELKAGVIDADYRDEWGVVARYPIPENELLSWFFWNEKTPQPKHFRVNPGDKVAQFLLLELPKVDLVWGPNATVIYKDEERVGGFGSTGK